MSNYSFLVEIMFIRSAESSVWLGAYTTIIVSARSQADAKLMLPVKLREELREAGLLAKFDGALKTLCRTDEIKEINENSFFSGFTFYRMGLMGIVLALTRYYFSAIIRPDCTISLAGDETRKI